MQIKQQNVLFQIKKELHLLKRKHQTYKLLLYYTAINMLEVYH